MKKREIPGEILEEIVGGIPEGISGWIPGAILGGIIYGGVSKRPPVENSISVENIMHKYLE